MSTKSPTIKELAKAAGVSPSTVSIVLSGKAEERKITEETKNTVLEMARKLGYHPNVSARRLRNNTNEGLILAVFWAADFRAPLMVRFLRGLQNAILESGRPCEIIIHTYRNDMLSHSMMALGMCHAAIICNASTADMEFLHENDFPIPIVLYNRRSDKYCTVTVNNTLMGVKAAEIFAARNRKHAILLASDSVFTGMENRTDGFTERCEQAGISVLRIHQDNSMKGGYHGGLAISSMRPIPDCVFAVSDSMALGAMRAFLQQGVRIPEDIEMISIGNADKEQEEYAAVSLSVIHLPMEKMADTCFALVLDLLDGKIETARCIELETKYVQRESCGGI